MTPSRPRTRCARCSSRANSPTYRSTTRQGSTSLSAPMPNNGEPGARDSATRFIAFSALFLALAILLPIGFHAFGLGGRVFLPMHIPVLLAGFLTGPLSGMLVGLLAPGASHLLTGMPPTYAVPLMTL